MLLLSFRLYLMYWTQSVRLYDLLLSTEYIVCVICWRGSEFLVQALPVVRPSITARIIVWVYVVYKAVVEMGDGVWIWCML